MTVHPNAQLLRDFYAAQLRDDKETLATQVTADVRWWAPVSAERRGLISNPIQGRAEVVDLLTVFAGQLYAPGRTWTVQHIVADDDTGAAQVDLIATLTANGQPYRNLYAFIFRFVDGQIAEAWEHTDTDNAYAQFGDAVADLAAAEG
jgi:ketosteroid isomerase-like protein